MHIALIAVPYDSGFRAKRMGAGPLHLLDSGLSTELEAAGHVVTTKTLALSIASRPAEIAATFELSGAVAHAVAAAVAAGSFPLVLSGNCGPAALGCVGGLQGRTNVFWFDAHGDFNTPETTTSGFLDGMALATVTGRCWTNLARDIPGFAAISQRKVTAIVDLDVLDPSEGLMNQFSARAGLSLPELEWAIATIAAGARVRAGSLTAFDPVSDVTGKARRTVAAVAVALTDAVNRSREE